MSETFADLEKDFLKVVREVVMCVVSTVDKAGKPRSRILHPIWEVVDGKPVGWIYTTPSPVKAAHLAANPHVSICYAGALGDVVLGECLASWVTAAETKKYVFDLFNNTPEPVGFDLRLFGIDSPEHPGFHVLRLDPTRVQVNTDFPRTFVPRMARI
ncbi:pyridoxamine 5'-phosphate oxidase family protein [Kibdelosporangium lantanae]